MIKNEIKIEDLAVAIAGLSQIVEKGFKQVDKRFEQVDKKIESEVNGLAMTTAKSFDRVEHRLVNIENNMTWVKNVLERHSGFLARLDQERIFTISHIHRLEDEINKIKKQLKIS